jgi:hypothetical protein
MGNVYRTKGENPEGEKHLKDLDVDGGLYKNILQKCDAKMWTGFIRLGIGTSGGFLRKLLT